MWSLVRDSLNREPRGEEYADWWGVHRTSHTRQLGRFRDCFEERSPERLIERLDTVAPAWRMGGVLALGAVEVRRLEIDSTVGNAWRVKRAENKLAG